MIKSTFVVASLATLALASNVAFAEGEEPAAEPAADAPAEPAADPAPADPAAEPAADAAGSFKGVAQEIINRTRTLPKGVIEVGGGLSFGKVSATVGTVTASATFSGLSVGGTYGVTDKIDVGATYSFALKEFEIKGDLGVRARMRLMANDKMSAAATLGLGYNVAGSALDPISVGVDFHYKVTPKIEVLSPGGQFVLGVDGGTTAAIKLPVGVGFQASNKIYAFVNTNLATIGLKPSGTTTIADAFGFTLGGYFSPSAQLDIGASLTTADVGGFADAYLISLLAAYRM